MKDRGPAGMGVMALLKIPAFAEPDELGKARRFFRSARLVAELHEASDEAFTPLPQRDPIDAADETGLLGWIIDDSR